MRAYQTVLPPGRGLAKAAVTAGPTVERPGDQPIAQRGQAGWAELASEQQDALRPTAVAARSAARSMQSLGAGVVRRLIALEREPKSEDRGIWYPLDLKRRLAERGADLPEGFIFGLAPEQFDHYEPMSFRVRPMTSASAALAAFFAGPTIAECGSVIVALQYAQLLDALGSAKFDKLFGSARSETHELLRMCIHSRGIGEGNPLGYFVRCRPLSSPGVVGDRPLIIGDQVYMGGVPDYIRKHPAGAGSGWNVVYCGCDEQGRQLFHGFGLGKPMTETEIRAVLVEHFNHERTDEDLAFIGRTKSTTWFDLDGHEVPETVIDEDGATHGFRPRSVKGFDSALVLAAVNAPAKQTQRRMIDHIRDQLGVEISMAMHELSSGHTP